jgi:hypothetical protein
MMTAFLALPSFAQDEPLKPTGDATKIAEDRLPDDAPKGASTSVAQSSPTTSSATSTSASATSSPASASGMPSEAEMMKMMVEMGKLNENHKLLTSLDGNWDYTVKMWMDGDSSKKPQESKGTATRKSVMGGRYVQMDVKGKFQMPWPDGKMKEVDFTGQGMEGYDNAKKKFVGTWMDSMGTGIVMSEGTYDPASKTFTYTSEYEMAPGMKQNIRETLKVPDNNHMTMEWYENRPGQGEVKTMQIDYTKKK